MVEKTGARNNPEMQCNATMMKGANMTTKKERQMSTDESSSQDYPGSAITNSRHFMTEPGQPVSVYVTAFNDSPYS
jgi:hypothetical protein